MSDHDAAKMAEGGEAAEAHFSELGEWRDRALKAERERGEARAEVARLRHDPRADARPVIEEWRAKAERAWSDATQAQERLGLAEALLREALKRIARLTNHADPICDECGGDATADGARHQPECVVKRIDAFLDGQPAPVKLTVDDAMVERLCRSVHGDSWALNLWPDDVQRTRNSMRAALVAALEGRT